MTTRFPALDELERFWVSDEDVNCLACMVKFRAAIDELVAALEKAEARYRSERRLRQAAESALAQALRHPNSKLDHVSEYLFRLEGLMVTNCASGWSRWFRTTRSTTTSVGAANLCATCLNTLIPLQRCPVTTAAGDRGQTIPESAGTGATAGKCSRGGMMRLIDADALRKVLADCPVACGPYAVDAVDAAPTVSCATCGFMSAAAEYTYGKVFLCGHESRFVSQRWHGFDFGCAYYERRGDGATEE